jgi:hypothetical protein
VGSRGRKSMTDLMIDGSTTIVQRPDAPYDLTDAEADEWRAIVNSMPAEHFARVHYPMLVQLCRHKAASNRVAQLVEQCCAKRKGKTFNLNEFDTLSAMQARETSAIIRLQRSMRLTQQSLYRAESVKPRPLIGTKKAPWDDDTDDSDES